MQDHEHQPLLLAAQVRVERGQRTDLAADTGIRLEVAEWVPKREYTGWWGASVSGLPPEQRANWSKTHDALLLPPGIYDVYWMQDHEHPPILVAECVKVNAHEVVVMPVH
jgi:hypothetical protein